jgi:hypothetical protein
MRAGLWPFPPNGWIPQSIKLVWKMPSVRVRDVPIYTVLRSYWRMNRAVPYSSPRRLADLRSVKDRGLIADRIGGPRGRGTAKARRGLRYAVRRRA